MLKKLSVLNEEMWQSKNNPAIGGKFDVLSLQFYIFTFSNKQETYKLEPAKYSVVRRTRPHVPGAPIPVAN